jgi:DNA-directed RNA polymerase specialized sigma24 family protein
MLPNDHELVRSFQQGDADAFATIDQMYRPDMLDFSFKLTHDQEKSAELVNKVFEALKQKHKLFFTLVNIEAFLRINVRNKSLDYLKSTQP